MTPEKNVHISGQFATIQLNCKNAKPKKKKKIERNAKCFAVMREIEQTVSHCRTWLIRRLVC